MTVFGRLEIDGNGIATIQVSERALPGLLRDASFEYGRATSVKGEQIGRWKGVPVLLKPSRKP